MNYKTLLSIMLFAGLLGCSNPNNKSSKEQPENKATSTLAQKTETPSEEWISLFDGESFKGWKLYNADEIGSFWSIEDGSIKCNGEGGGEAYGDLGGALTTIDTFEDFELSLEWKLSEGGNSGIMYHVVEKPENKYAYVTGPEYQVTNHPADPSKVSIKGIASCYDMYGPDPALLKQKPAMEWNTSRIRHKDSFVEYWLNGQKVLKFKEGTDDYEKRLNKSKWGSGEFPAWNISKVGAIALQDHGSFVWYRDIRIKRL